MAEDLDVTGSLRKLQNLPEGLHWFCPRDGLKDDTQYYPEDGYDSTQFDDKEVRRRSDAIEEAKKRSDTVTNALVIFAFDGEDAVNLQNWVAKRLDAFLSSCDVCVRQFHRGRGELKQFLLSQYDEEDVTAFFTKYDALSVDRIIKRLDFTREILTALEPTKRSIQALGPAEVFAIFEVLSCDPFLRNPHLLKQHFDEPFQLVQTKKYLRLANLLPASTEFLFSEPGIRYNWAKNSWDKLKHTPSKDEFEWCIKAPLFRAMMRVQNYNLDLEFLPRFWASARLIVSHLDKDLITHGLRAMDCDIVKLALDHMQVDTDAFPDMVGTLQQILKMSPGSFWESMGSIGAPDVINAIFSSPALQRMLKAHGQENGDGKTPPPLNQLLGWTEPLITSLKSINMPPACRALASQLLDRCSSDRYSTSTRATTFNTGLRVILQTMVALGNGDYKTMSPASVTDALEVVSYFMPRILERLKGLRNLDKRDESAALSLQVVERALLLDCLVLRIEHDILKNQGQLGPERHARTAGLWQKITEAIGSNEQALATYALRGARELVGLERIVTKKSEELSKDAKQFNTSFDALCGQVGAILDRINDKFSTEDLTGLFKSPHLATGPVSVLLLSDASARQSAVDLTKSMSGEVDRRDALASVFKSSYLSTMSALNEIMQRITARRTFTPISITRRFAADIVDVLCDTQDGLLKTQTLSNDEKQATWTFWENVWKLLRTIFERTEFWGEVGYGKELMIEFCRDTMQFAEQLFNSYHAFADGLGDDQDKATADKLLERPREVMASMVKWIRLRDEYLINTIVTLVTGLLAKLGNLDLRVTDEALAFIQSVIDKQTKTKLTPQQLAQLSRAVDEHTGEESTPPLVEDKVAAKKQGSINQWVKTGQAVRDIDSDRSDGTQKIVKAATTNLDRYKLQQAQLEERRKKADAAAAAKRDAKRDIPAINKVQNQADFLKKRKAEKEAKDKAAAEAKAKALALRNVGAGSALQGLGNIGKDHTKGTGMMVDSDEYSSSDDENDEFDRELFGTSKPVKRDRAVNGFEFDKTKVPARAPVKIQRMQRSVKDMRARLAPDLTKLHRTILGWNYYHEGKYPPGSDGHEYTAVPGKFRDPVQYGQIFQPLLLLEAWQSFVTAREEKPGQPYPIQIVSRGNVDMLIEVSAVLQHEHNKDQHVGEGDIVILSKQRMANQEEPSCLARVHKIKRKKQALEVIYRTAPGNPMMSALTPNQTVHANKIQSITPLEREFGALQGLQYYDLCDYIVGGQPSHLLTYNEKKLNSIVDNYKLNKAQATAVQSAIDNDAFTLIQGPPGTGKTKTIVAIVGALLSQVLRDEKQGVAHSMPTGYNNGNNNDRAPPKKLLVCAPSNAAVDELVMRMKNGVRTVNGVDKQIKVVRLGRSDAINAAVQDVTLEELVNIKLHGQTSKGDQKGDTQKLFNDHKAVSEKLREARDKEGTLKGAEANQLLDEISALVKRKKELSTLIDDAKDKEGAANREADLQRKRAQQMVLDEAHVICATLSGSGHEMFQNLNIEFETVIVDEAAQCVEMSVLIPLKYGCAKCILVGDPKQLPPTVFSREAAEYQYEQSLFVRMQRNYPNEVHLLDTQYRMHPEISLFPSASFYDHRLLDGANMAEQRVRPWHQNSLFGPYWFFDVRGQETKAGKSLVNRHEIEVASQLYEKLIAGFGQKYDFKGKIGVITPYKSQLRELKSHFSNKYGRDIVDEIEFNTTDAFQGRESEIIIFSCVRASGTGIGFLKDIRRMNVGLTRAKASLWVLGDTRTLSAGEYWGKLVEDARSRDRLLLEAEYGPSLRNGTPLKNEHKAMVKKPQIKSEPNGKGITSPAPNPADTSDSDSRRSVNIKSEPHIKREPGTIKHEPGVNSEPSIKSEPRVKREMSIDSATGAKKRKADFDFTEDTDMPDAPAVDAHFGDDKSRSNLNSEPAAGFSGMFNAPKQQIRKRKVDNGVFMKKPKVARKEG